MCRVVLPCLHQFKIKVSIKESSLFIPLGEVGGGGQGKIRRGTETFEVLPWGEGFGGIVTVST